MANGLVDYSIIKPGLSFDVMRQNEQQRIKTGIDNLELERLTNERKTMLDFQKQLADMGQNPDLGVVFDSMIKTGNPDYVNKGLEGKRKLQEQKQFAQIMGYDMTPPTAGAAPAMTAPVGEAPVNALAANAPTAPVAPANALTRQPSKGAPDETVALTQKIDQLIALGTPQAIQAANALQGRLKQQSVPVVVGPKSALINPATGEVVYRNTAAETVPGQMLSPKDLQKREADYPRATSAMKGFESKSDGFIKDLEKLRDHPGLDNITGFIAGRVPSLTAEGRAAQALYNKVTAKGGFQALQDMREASKTGGALGSVSNQEGKQLIASFAAIDQVQDKKDVQEAINQAVTDIQGAKTRMREAYDMTYDYRLGKGGEKPTAPAAPGAPSAANTVTLPNGVVKVFPTPEAAAQFKKAAGL
jgi:hypothetical protein